MLVEQDISMDQIDYRKLYDEIIDSMDSEGDGTVQVFEGSADSVRIEHFSCCTSKDINQLIHFIKANGLQEKPPWSVAWNLYQCLLSSRKV